MSQAATNLGSMLGLPELVKLCAADPLLYCKTFFPSTFRQPSPDFHKDVFSLLEAPPERHVAIEVFRGGAKTTLLRAYTSKRIAYGISRTILLLGVSQDRAKDSLAWIKKQVEHNRSWTQVFGVEKGVTWTDERVDIRLRALGHTVTVLAAGITASGLRGINIDDWRPDLIVIDDPSNEENSATPEQRQKISDVVFGALDKSLAPRSDSPDAKMVILATSLDSEDLINNCHRDPNWASRKYSCFDEQGRSRWEARYPTEELVKEKAEHIDKGQRYLLLWLREKECLLVGGEAARFKLSWLKEWDTLPETMTVFLGLDPVPPPSDREVAKGLADKDFEALSAVGVAKGDMFLLDYSESKGHTPEWTIAETFAFMSRWRPLKLRVEGVAYQRTLKWILEKAMRERGQYIQVDCPSDRRAKVHRIDQALSGLASQGRFYVHRSHTRFKEQFGSFPMSSHEDVLDATARAVEAAQDSGAFLPYAPMHVTEVDDSWRWAP